MAGEERASEDRELKCLMHAPSTLVLCLSEALHCRSTPSAGMLEKAALPPAVLSYKVATEKVHPEVHSLRAWRGSADQTRARRARCPRPAQ
jgi:hypothetical protein